ncbi:MAG: hypothetical protein K6F28_08575 [Lachnospiraceae bacterium]|nr:hypothetical protein [Lachnospiraceae bacterium]
MKRKTVKIMAAVLASAIIVTTFMEDAPIYAGELELTEETIETDGIPLTDESLESDMGQQEVFVENTWDTDVAEDEAATSENGNASSKRLAIKSSSAKLFKKMAGSGKSILYSKLTSEQKGIYKKIDKEISRILYKGGKLGECGGAPSTKPIMIKKHYSVEKLRFIVDVYMLDNPQAFFLKPVDNGFSYGINDGILQLQVLKDTDSPAKIKKKGDEIAKNLNADLKKIKRKKGDYNKAKKIQELLCARVSKNNDMERNSLLYTYSNSNNEAHYYAYAASFEALARLAGLNAYSLPGADGGSRKAVWNKIKAGGKWYNVDTYWDDFTQMQTSPACRYDYFLKSDNTIKDVFRCHILDPKFSKFNKKSKKDY